MKNVFISSRLTIVNKPQKLSTKLYFKKLADKVVQSKEEQINIPKGSEGINDAAKSKLRYIVRACIHKVIGRLQTNVFKSIGKGEGGNQLQRQVITGHFTCSRLRISEDEAKKITEV